MWLDHRAHAEASIINASSDEVLKNFGGKISLEMQPGKLMWLKRNLSKEQWTRARHFFDLPDYLHFRATEQFDRSLCSSVCKLCYRSSETKQGWDEKFWAKFDLNDLMENNGEKLGQLVRKPFSKSDTDVLSKKAADELGLSPGIRVGTPLIDAYAGALGGLACKSPIPDAHLTERLVIVAGYDENIFIFITFFLFPIDSTSSCFMACSEKAVFAPGVWGPHYNVLIPSLWLSEGGQSAAGKSIDHIVQSHPAYNELKQLADEQKTTTFDILNGILNNLQNKYKMGNISFLSGDLHMTIDFHGNRSPLADPELGAAIVGLRFDTSLNNLAIQYLAVIQAVAYDSRHIIEAMSKAGHHFRVVQICGGLARLPLLTQIIADVVQMPVYVSEPTNDCVLLGAAICGQLIADNAGQVEALLNDVACPIQTFMPDTKMADFHKAKYEIYRLLQKTEMDSRARMSKYCRS
jgi:FGGY-family pentulose kinase